MTLHLPYFNNKFLCYLVHKKYFQSRLQSTHTSPSHIRYKLTFWISILYLNHTKYPPPNLPYKPKKWATKNHILSIFNYKSSWRKHEQHDIVEWLWRLSRVTKHRWIWLWYWYLIWHTFAHHNHHLSFLLLY